MLILIAVCFGKRQEFPLAESLDEMKAGSMPGNHIYLPYKGVSREHFRLVRGPDGWTLLDLDSRNGTSVNGKKVREAALRPGDEIKAGTVTLTVQAAAPDAETVLLQKRSLRPRRRDTEEVSSAEPPAPGFYFPQLVFPEGMIPGQSQAMMEVYRKLHSIASADVHVLFIGETGCGKEMLARTLHLSGRRAGGAFVAVNCAAIPADLAESELFGIGEKVATNVNRRAGKMELAHGGTLLLDELSSFPMPLQAKILRVVEEKAVSAVGESRPRPADFRLMATTNEEPKLLLETSRLREDLYHRIATVEIRVPPLRARREDIEPLLAGFIDQASTREGKQISGYRRSILDMLLRYSYPGNVRELANIVKGMVALASPGEILDVPLLPEKVRDAGDPEQTSREPLRLHSRLDDVTKELVLKALEDTGGNISAAAGRLGITPRGLRKMMQRLGLDRS